MSKRIPYDNKSHKRVIREAIRAKEQHRMSFLQADRDDTRKPTKKSHTRPLWLAVVALLAIVAATHAEARGSSGAHRGGNHGHKSHSASTSGNAVSSFRSIYK